MEVKPYRTIVLIGVENGHSYPIKETPTLKPSSPRLDSCQGQNSFTLVHLSPFKTNVFECIGLHMREPTSSAPVHWLHAWAVTLLSYDVQSNPDMVADKIVPNCLHYSNTNWTLHEREELWTTSDPPSCLSHATWEMADARWQFFHAPVSFMTLFVMWHGMQCIASLWIQRGSSYRLVLITPLHPQKASMICYYNYTDVFWLR